MPTPKIPAVSKSCVNRKKIPSGWRIVTSDIIPLGSKMLLLNGVVVCIRRIKRGK